MDRSHVRLWGRLDVDAVKSIIDSFIIVLLGAQSKNTKSQKVLSAIEYLLGDKFNKFKSKIVLRWDFFILFPTPCCLSFALSWTSSNLRDSVPVCERYRTESLFTCTVLHVHRPPRYGLMKSTDRSFKTSVIVSVRKRPGTMEQVQTFRRRYPRTLK